MYLWTSLASSAWCPYDVLIDIPGASLCMECGEQSSEGFPPTECREKGFPSLVFTERNCKQFSGNCPEWSPWLLFLPENAQSCTTFSAIQHILWRRLHCVMIESWNGQLSLHIFEENSLNKWESRTTLVCTQLITWSGSDLDCGCIPDGRPLDVCQASNRKLNSE